MPIGNTTKSFCKFKMQIAVFFFLSSSTFVTAQSSNQQAYDTLMVDSLFNYYEPIYTKELKSIIQNNQQPDSLFKKLYAFAPPNYSLILSVNKVNYELIDSYMLYKIKINKEIELSPSTFSSIGYSLNILRFNSEILRLEFNCYTDSFLLTKKVKYNNFLNLYQRVFYKKINWNDIIKDTSLIYGDWCYYEGVKIDEMTTIEKAVQSKNITLLDDWIGSTMPVLQAFAVNGFYQLYKSGYSLTPHQRKMVEIVKNKKGMLRTCSGCLVEEREFKDVLGEFNFD